LILREAGDEVNGSDATVSRAWGRGRWRGNSVNGLRKRMAAARSEAEVEVVAHSKSGVEAAAHSEARVKVAVCSVAGDEAAVCSSPGIENGIRWRHDGV
jgi:hypothetical protein